MKILTVVPVLTLLQSALTETTNLKYIDYRLIEEHNVTVISDQCENIGVNCLGCRDLVYCSKTSNGDWEETSIGQCQPQQSCHKGTCVNRVSPQCNPAKDVRFPCSSVGVFPDPDDCKKYYFCVPESSENLKSVHLDCTSSDGMNYGYNPRSFYCDKILTPGDCPKIPVPICLEVGQTEALENPSIYYICAQYFDNPSVLYPYQMVCPNGGIFGTVDGCIIL